MNLKPKGYIFPSLLSGCFAYHNTEFDVHRLMSKLMSGYSTAVRPVVNYRDTVTVDLSLTLVELLDMVSILYI